MFIYFHGCIFDPVEITMVQAGEDGLWIQTAGAAKVALIECSEAEALLMAGELFQIMLDKGIACESEDGPEYELDGDEQLILSDALAAGYEYIARDKDGRAFAYRNKPRKGRYAYEPNEAYVLPLGKEKFTAIQFDTGPVSIAYLLLDND